MAGMFNLIMAIVCGLFNLIMAFHIEQTFFNLVVAFYIEQTLFNLVMAFHIAQTSSRCSLSPTLEPTTVCSCNVPFLGPELFRIGCCFGAVFFWGTFLHRVRRAFKCRAI